MLGDSKSAMSDSPGEMNHGTLCLGQGRPRVPLGKQGSVDVCGEMNMLAQALGWSMALTSSLSYAMATSYCHSAE